MTIDGVKDVFEISFVGIPAQPRAGVSKAKRYNPDLPEKKPSDFNDEEKKEARFDEKELVEMELFLMAEEAAEEE